MQDVSYNMEDTSCIVQHGRYILHCTTWKIHPALYNMEDTSCIVQHGRYILHFPMLYNTPLPHVYNICFRWFWTMPTLRCASTMWRITWIPRWEVWWSLSICLWMSNTWYIARCATHYFTQSLRYAETWFKAQNRGKSYDSYQIDGVLTIFHRRAKWWQKTVEEIRAKWWQKTVEEIRVVHFGLCTLHLAYIYNCHFQ